jgi:hypothetical protein
LVLVLVLAEFVNGWTDAPNIITTAVIYTFSLSKRSSDGNIMNMLVHLQNRCCSNSGKALLSRLLLIW